MLQLLLLSFIHIFHPFYVSVTEIKQNPKTKTVQVSARIFFDDLERALDKKYKVNVNILKPASKKQVDHLIAAYINEHLKLKINGQPLSLKYMGYEIEEEAAWCYFESEATGPVKTLAIQNDVLFEQHESQINMIHATVNGKRQSTKLDNPDSRASFSY
jgi:hypothetical protein